jgi:hypothetical protein
VFASTANDQPMIHRSSENSAGANSLTTPLLVVVPTPRRGRKDREKWPYGGAFRAGWGTVDGRSGGTYQREPAAALYHSGICSQATRRQKPRANIAQTWWG